MTVEGLVSSKNLLCNAFPVVSEFVYINAIHNSHHCVRKLNTIFNIRARTPHYSPGIDMKGRDESIR